MTTLTELTKTRGFEILEHLEADAEIPVNDGFQAQGDIAIIPIGDLKNRVDYKPSALTPIFKDGVQVVRGENGGHTHLLVADPGTGFWTDQVRDDTGLAVGVLMCTSPVHLLHAEHGGTGIAPGSYVIRRQREQAEEQRLVAD